MIWVMDSIPWVRCASGNVFIIPPEFLQFCFDHQCFAERESILKRQFCVVEQYSDFSLQKHFMETTTTKSHLWEYFEWLPSGKGICKTCKNEIVDWLGWRVRTRGGGEEIDFFIVFDIGYNKMDNYCTARLMIIALWWWYCQTHNLYSGFERQNSSCGEDLILRF